MRRLLACLRSCVLICTLIGCDAAEAPKSRQPVSATQPTTSPVGGPTSPARAFQLIGAQQRINSGAIAVELTTPEILSSLGVQVFRIEDAGAGAPAFVIDANSTVVRIGGGFGGYGCEQMFVTDLDGDGRAELICLSSFGSGVGWKAIAFWKPGMQHPLDVLTTADESLQVSRTDARKVSITASELVTGNTHPYGEIVWDAGTERPVLRRTQPMTLRSGNPQ